MTTPAPAQLPVNLFPVRFLCPVSTYSPTVTGLAARNATDTLWALTGRQFGLLQLSVRPYHWSSLSVPWPSGAMPWQGTLVAPYGGPYGGIGPWEGIYGQTLDICGFARAAKLPAPVYSVDQVTIDGVTLDPSAYQLVDQRWLYRVDGNQWPQSNQITGAPDAVGTWVIKATFGTPPPAGIELPMGELACEFLRALSGEDCRLPRNVTSLARQGVTITLPDVSQSFKEGLTGLRLVDQFVLTWNPSRLRRRAGTYSVDGHAVRRVTQ